MYFSWYMLSNTPIKVVKTKTEIRRFFNSQIVNSERVVMGGKTMYMTINKIDDLGKEVKHKIVNLKSNIKEKQCGNCSDVKSVKYFYSDSYSKDGYSHWCNLCVKSYSKEYNEEKKREREKE